MFERIDYALHFFLIILKKKNNNKKQIKMNYKMALGIKSNTLKIEISIKNTLR